MYQRGFAKKRFFIGLAVLVCAGFLWGYLHRQATQNQRPDYLTATVHRGKIVATVTAVGTVEPIKSVNVGAQVSGKITKLLVKVGDKVKAGDAIAEIDAAMQRNSKQTAEAALRGRKAALAGAQASLQEARQNEQRQRGLFARGAASQEAVQRAFTVLQNAKANVAQAQAAVEASRLEVSNADLNMQHTHVSAPIAGTIVSTLVEQGQTVNALQNVPTLVQIAQTETMAVKPEISEADVNQVRAGMPAYVQLLGDSSKRFDSVLLSVNPAPMTGSHAVYYAGRLEIANPQNVLRIGMTAKVSIITQQADDALLIPLTAVHSAADGKSRVEVVKDGKLSSKMVQTGINDGVNVQIISGLQEGEAVIISQGAGESADRYISL